jgi:NAD(P)-dependent dehydrogenase (short-subunit alcohol dehydrogenase family)
MSNPSTAGQLDGKLALVTGDGSGIGEATARFFALEGAIVVVAGRRRKQIEPVAADIDGHAIVCDVSDPGQVQNLFQKSSKLRGGSTYCSTTPAALDPSRQLLR